MVVKSLLRANLCLPPAVIKFGARNSRPIKQNQVWEPGICQVQVKDVILSPKKGKTPSGRQGGRQAEGSLKDTALDGNGQN